MSNNSDQKTDKSPFIAAAIIMAVLMGSYFFMPPLLLAIAQVNEYLAYAVGALFIVSFFGVLWLRAHYQKKRDRHTGE